MIKIVLMKILGYCVAVKIRIDLRQRKEDENHVIDEIKQECTVKDLQSWPKYVRQTLVLV